MPRDLGNCFSKSKSVDASFSVRCLVMHDPAYSIPATIKSWGNQQNWNLRTNVLPKNSDICSYHQKAIITWESDVFCMEEVFFYNKNWTKWKIEWDGMSLIPNVLKMTCVFCNSILAVCLILFYPTVKILKKIHSHKRPNLHMVWNRTRNTKGLTIFFFF